MINPTTTLCMRCDFEKRMPFLTNLLHQVRNDKCLRSMRCVFLLPVITVLSVMRFL